MPFFLWPRLIEQLFERTPTGVNATDNTGRTPLDWLVQEIGQRRQPKACLEYTSQAIRLLAQRGGFLRKASQRDWELFLALCGRETDMIRELGLPRWLPGLAPSLDVQINVRGRSILQSGLVILRSVTAWGIH